MALEQAWFRALTFLLPDAWKDAEPTGARPVEKPVRPRRLLTGRASATQMVTLGGKRADHIDIEEHS